MKTLLHMTVSVLALAAAAGLAPVAVEKGLVGHLNLDGPANPAIFAADHPDRMAMED